jgi:hypothetical protein
MPLFDDLVIRAKHIDVETSAHGAIKTLTIHLPDATTREQLATCNRNTTINGIKLVDEFDDGSLDEHENHATFSVVACFTESARKKNTVTLILIDLNVVWRLEM